MNSKLLLAASILCAALYNVSCNGNKEEKQTETTSTQETLHADTDTSTIVKPETSISATVKSATDTLSTVNSLKTEKKTSLSDTASVKAIQIITLSPVPAFSNEDVTEGLNEIRSLMQGSISAAQNKDTAKMKEYETKMKSLSKFSIMSWMMKLKSDEGKKMMAYMETLAKETEEGLKKIETEHEKN
jgi:hypothetical protein